MRSVFDVIIVGGGTAGAVIAGRLAGHGGATLLIEAGPDWRRPGLPDALRGADWAPAMDRLRLVPWYWDNTYARLTRDTKRVCYTRARGLGGTSLVNCQVGLRPALDQFDEWSRLGLPLGSGRALDLFKRIETDLDGDDSPVHGSDGPLMISRRTPATWGPLDRAFALACGALGFPYTADLNAMEGDGHGPYPLTASPGGRHTSVDGYLSGPLEHLTVIPHAVVDAITFRPGRPLTANGVVWSGVEGVGRAYADTVILAAGALGSPAVLQRSGIGPPAALHRLGVDVRSSAPVGDAVHEHPYVALTSSRRLAAPDGLPSMVCGLRYTTPVAPHRPLDMAIAPASSFAVGDEVIPTQVLVAQHESVSRGSLRLDDATPHGPIVVDLNLLADEADRRRLRHGVRTAAELAANDALHRVTGPLRIGGHDVAHLPDDDRALDRVIRRACAASGHLSSSCRAGLEDDPLAVVDGHGAVLGVDGVYVADLSIAPSSPRANPSLTALVLAEHVADGIIGVTP
jgi:choline dehydrogenase-like flavoprotein